MAHLTTAQVAEELQVHPRHVLTLIATKQLAATNIASRRTHGARWRIAHFQSPDGMYRQGPLVTPVQ